VQPQPDATAALQAQMQELQRKMEVMNKEAEAMKRERAAASAVKAKMQRYLSVVPVADAELPSPELPAVGEDARAGYLFLHYLLNHWQHRGCFPFTEGDLGKELGDNLSLENCITTLLGSQCRIWHQTVQSNADTVIPNQMAMVLSRQLAQMCDLSNDAELDVEEFKHKAEASYTTLHNSAKRHKMTA